MLLALRTDTSPMTAETLQLYNHPHGKHADGRGSMQIMENNNAFLGWWMRSLVSEYTPEGKLIMRAGWRPMLKSYRSYKFNWVGQPVEPPTVHSEARIVGKADRSNAFRTVVHVSWNGATEVGSWKLYRATPNQEQKTLITSTSRQGFETKFVHHGFLSHVVVEGVDREGKYLGESKVFRTITPNGMPDPVVEGGSSEDPNFNEDANGHGDSHTEDETDTAGSDDILLFLLNPITIAICGVAFCVAIVFTVGVVCSRPWWPWRKQERPGPRYEALLESETEDDFFDGEGR